MTADAAAVQLVESSPRAKARAAGLFELLEAIASASGQVVILGRFIVPGNAAATAASILAHERLYWLGFATLCRSTSTWCSSDCGAP